MTQMAVFGVFILRQAQDEGGLRVSREVAMLADMQFTVYIGLLLVGALLRFSDTKLRF